MKYGILAFATLLLSGPGCGSCNKPSGPGDGGMDSQATAAPVTAPVTAQPPETLLVVMRGATLRRAVPLMFPQGGVESVLEQLARQITPGVADHGDEIDADSPFAVAGTVTGANESTLTLFVAWPLKPGMQISQDARNRRGFRVVADGLYAPTAADAGANAEHQCWVAQRPPVGWMLLCGPREHLPQVAGFLRERASTAPDNAAVLEVDLRAALARRLASRQLAEIDRNAPPRADAGMEAVRRAMFDQARRSAAFVSALATDVDTLHGAVTQDENAMHLRAEMVVNRASSDQTRALVAAAAGRQASAELLGSLPATVQSYILGGFDRGQIVRALGGGELDPAIAMQAGPELARVMGAIDEVKNLTPLGERVDAYSPEDGYTMYHVVRRADAVQFVSDLRVALNSVPARPLPEGGTLRDVAAQLPTPGLTGPNVLRIGRNVHIPPGVQVPPEVRAVIERSMLLVAEGDRLIAVMGRDPVARYRAMTQGPRLAATVPANAVLTGRVTPPAFPPLIYGAQIPGLPESRTTDALDFALLVERRGEGARVELRADAPIGAATELRGMYAMIQELQERMMRQMMEQQQRAQQQQQGGAGGMMRPPGQRAPQPQRPQLDPSMLPEPPQLQLRPPQ